MHLNAASARVRFDAASLQPLIAVVIPHWDRSECYSKGNAGGGSPHFRCLLQPRLTH